MRYYALWIIEEPVDVAEGERRKGDEVREWKETRERDGRKREEMKRESGGENERLKDEKEKERGGKEWRSEGVMKRMKTKGGGKNEGVNNEGEKNWAEGERMKKVKELRKEWKER